MVYADSRMSRSMAGRRPAFRRPDHEEQREGNHLLIWRDIPFWMIVDHELRTLLTTMDGQYDIDARLATLSRSQKKAALRALGQLHAAGVFLDEQGTAPTAGVRPEPGIANVSINVTAKCNLRCRFCYNLDALESDPRGELSADGITGFLDSIKSSLAKGCSLTLLGGEPLLVPAKTLKLAQYGRKNGFQTMVSTNGHCVTDEFAAGARRSRLQVQVSLDGPDAEAHDRVRGRGSFVRTLGGIRKLVDQRVFTILSLVCHKDNLHCLEPFYSLARDLGVSEARFIPLKRLGGACKAGLEPANPKELVTTAAALFRGHPEFRTLAGRDALSILAATCAHSIRQPSCGTGLRTFLLDATGDIYPCLNTCVPELRVGNIREPAFDFARLWAESPLLNRVRESTSVENVQNKCYNCVVKYWCLGYCRGETFQAKGSLSGRATDCSQQREAVLEMFWLLGTERDLMRRSRI
jgi:radical SAM protein with 4Fe4S-binding SPASM domain